MKYVLILLIGLFSNQVLFAQENDSIVKGFVDQIKENISQNNFKEAQELLKKVFNLQVPVPDEMAYFLGVTQFNLKKSTSAKESLKKYVALSGEKGSFYHESLRLLREIDCLEKGSYETEIVCLECGGEGASEIPCRTCRAKGKTICNICGGNGVMQQKDNFGTKYLSCTKCSGSGIASCNVCEGTKKENIRCYYCQGNGKTKIKRSCNEY